ncbi:zinc-binding alcohol dehydrogenase family protein [Lactococcus lactis]|uniref:zinc-binding alcohol dehydrogenase family protein n=1 Tax=Lactococcus lactis TaxID=1358 RepID=UPI00050D6FCE|nr:zinc-binding alcohol dehydrogenase family protein [Lactococcus lactis]AIS03126.1 Zinc-binding alcohol dehydrogenase [Lactococcus lactis]
MKAYGPKGKGIDTIIEFETAIPNLKPHDLLIKIEGVSINPVDTKIRKNLADDLSSPVILGWDGIGTVVDKGRDVSLFEIGDQVFWAGDVTRSGSNAEFEAVDERIVGYAPKKISKENAVAMPLTSLTAYELLFEKLQVSIKDKGKSLLIINGAGGVGSVATQMAKQAGLTVIASASNPRAIEWVRNLGADFTVNHHEDLTIQVRDLGFHYVDYILILNAVDQHMSAVNELIAPQGHIANIVQPKFPLVLDKLAHKSASFSFEWMYTKVVSNTSDLKSQHDILNKISQWLDNGQLKTTMTENFGEINATNLRIAHEKIEKNKTIGKIVLTSSNDF